jgi:hypothetical protein
MKMRTIASLLAACLLPLSALATNPIDGRWVGEYTYPGGTQLEVTFYFKVDGQKVTGRADSKAGPAPILSGTIDGNNFDFKVSFNDSLINHECMVSGDTITMKVTFAGQQPSTMILHRVADVPLAVPPDPSGHWNWTVTPPGGTRTFQVSATLVFSLGTLSGTYHGRLGDAAISDASFKDGVVAFSVARDYEGKPFLLKYQGTLSGDTLTGTVAIPPFEGAGASTIGWSATRTKRSGGPEAPPLPEGQVGDPDQR